MKSKSEIDLERARPEQIEDDISPLELAEAVEAMPAWSARSLAVVNEVLTNWVADAIGRPNDSDGLVALQSAIERIRYAKASRTEGLTQRDVTDPASYGNRWSGFSDAIAARHIVLVERAPDRVRQLSHVASIEGILKQEKSWLSQSAVQIGTGLKPSRLSQVLSLMEAHGMIERRSSGKEKQLRLAAIVRPAELPANSINGPSKFEGRLLEQMAA